MRRVLVGWVLILLMIMAGSCGGGSSTNASLPVSNVMQLQGGNWVFEGGSDPAIVAPLILGAILSQSNANVVISIAPLSPCLTPASVPTVQSTATATGLTVTATFGDATLTMVLTGGGTKMTGTYTITGGCASGEHGTVTATYVPPVTGTWKGTVTSIFPGAQSHDVTLTLAQSDTPTFAFYTLTGTAQIAGTTCMSTATIGPGTPFSAPSPVPSVITGSTLTMNLTAPDATTATAIATLVPTGYDKQMNLIISGSSFAGGSPCPEIAGSGILTKQ